jgi:hypothetical protein
MKQPVLLHPEAIPMAAPTSRSSTLRWILLVAALAASALGCAYFGVGLANNAFVRRLNAEIAPPDAPAETRVLRTFERVSRWEYFDESRISSPLLRWVARIEHRSPLHLSARSTLTGGVDHIGPCGSLSRSMIVLLRQAKIPVRKVILYTPAGIPKHTVVEVSLDGEWRVFDPTYGWYWRRSGDGEIASADDLCRDRALFVSIQERLPHYPVEEYGYCQAQHLRWEKIPGLPRVRRLLTGVLGEERMRAIGTPYLYERPSYLVGAGFLGLGLVLLLVRRRLPASERRGGRREPTPPPGVQGMAGYASERAAEEVEGGPEGFAARP